MGIVYKGVASGQVLELKPPLFSSRCNEYKHEKVHVILLARY